jgi:hypothetical protein
MEFVFSACGTSDALEILGAAGKKGLEARVITIAAARHQIRRRAREEEGGFAGQDLLISGRLEKRIGTAIGTKSVYFSDLLVITTLKTRRDIGRPCGIRTCDQRIKSPLLYQLS